MGKWTIDKQFSFCYGHRVWSQLLKHDYCESGDTKAKCRHLHGHEGLVHVFLEGEQLERGMVTDFKHLGWLKNFIDTYIDHKFIIDYNDPRFESLVIAPHMELTKSAGIQFTDYWGVDPAQTFTAICASPIYVSGTNHVAAYELNLDFAHKEKSLAVYEQLEGYTIVDFVPTSENLSKWLFYIVKAKMDLINVVTKRIDWFETPKSRASYSE